MSRYKDFTNLAADIAWETDGDGNITYISGTERFGYKNSQIVGLKATKIINKRTVWTTKSWKFNFLHFWENPKFDKSLGEVRSKKCFWNKSI